MLKIKRVEIEGFRGFTQKTSIEFENPITLLHGGNHQGKSSALNAIEWCLYGDECIGEKSGIRERVGTGEFTWRVVNDNSEKAKVKVELEGEDRRNRTGRIIIVTLVMFFLLLADSAFA